MAVTKEPLGSKMVTRLNYGTDDETGKEIIKSKTYSNVHEAADITECYNIAEMICALQVPVLDEVLLNEFNLLLSI